MKPAQAGAVVMGCSAGGLQALRVVLAGLHARLPVPLILVCHTGSEDVDLLVSLLARDSTLPVEEACERHAPAGGIVYVAPSGYHLLIERAAPEVAEVSWEAAPAVRSALRPPQFALSIDAKVCFVRPSIDVLFESAADVFRAGLVAVLMTGANDDGAAGLRAVRARGGRAIVQDPAEAFAPEMPQAALRVAGADHVCKLAGIAPTINTWCG